MKVDTTADEFSIKADEIIPSFDDVAKTIADEVIGYSFLLTKL